MFLGASNVQSNIDRSPSSTSISRNHSASGLGDGNGDHTKVSFPIKMSDILFFFIIVTVELKKFQNFFLFVAFRVTLIS